ncbi:DUF3021 family protein [Pseudalkalibacillus berkeleyi]|uniref:DUF3021 domain-containing protein n=1 Tax=Pseudalkalibacillus berkeleyi TaxID=1069813 RepID=A0ABS9GYJ2_9BACL|nr:DUF3021 family protein [Pseudalkalibacillus berkeleyi]MCF6136670.1 DUF3021 domain-containing protein [Pseudalkalibacillus berkeleyi]
MFKEMIRRGFIGISYSGIITFCALTIIKVNELNVSASEIWVHMLGSIALGIFWGMASLIFENESFSPLMQILIHFSASIIFFYPIAILLGWITLSAITILSSFIIFIMIYFIFWFTIRFYITRMASSLNNAIK